MPRTFCPDCAVQRGHRHCIVEETSSLLVARGLCRGVTGFLSNKHLVPSLLGSSNNVGGNIGDGFIVQASSERGHGVLSVGDLGDDSLLIASTSKVGLKGLLLKGLFRHDHILSTGVASSAVGIEDLLSVVNIPGKCGLNGNSECNGTSSGSLQEIEELICETKSKLLQSFTMGIHA